MLFSKKSCSQMYEATTGPLERGECFWEGSTLQLFDIALVPGLSAI